MEKQTQLNASSPRIEYLDTLRILACFLVLFTHSAMPADASDGVSLSIVSLLGSPSSELFLALSGAILLPIKTDMNAFYKRRFSKLLPPLIIWSVVYTFISYFSKEIDLNTALTNIIKIPFTNVVGVYWFMYVMVGLYLFAPFISPWLKNATKKEIETFLLLWGISLLMPYLNYLIPGIYNDKGNYYWMLITFSGFLGYWILGHYLCRFPIKIGMNARWIGCVVGIVVYLSILLVAYANNANVAPLFDNLQIGSALFVVFLFTIIQHIHTYIHTASWVSKNIKYLFGIYLIHIIVVRRIVWLFFESSTINPIVETTVIALTSLIASLLIVKILSKLPFSKYIIGV